ncbi:hypothetical protein N2599_20145 [Rhizobium sullae]|uniref:ABC transmembrane type-1 domain-containing protein n=1 Tax=Rhizobium sullae TaxID=50338 RepID=A0A2N0DDH0_RHISU|nr:hypothetical protein [Rhizobium sullae]PKA44152.1 hypothetical protein CWR43_07600 [Rhizobium sullae]UWU14390.1 hypothetical protein N2599_20145 [Rhizobium sullae]
MREIFQEDDETHPVPLAWFTQSTLRFTPLILELMLAAVVIRLLGLVEPFVFQAIIDRVLPFQREATLTLIVIVLVLVLVLVMITSSTLHVLSSYLGNHMSNRLVAEWRIVFFTT